MSLLVLAFVQADCLVVAALLPPGLRRARRLCSITLGCKHSFLIFPSYQLQQWDHGVMKTQQHSRCVVSLLTAASFPVEYGDLFTCR
jgi:hypothetical protein